jgi:hypothetical protein
MLQLDKTAEGTSQLTGRIGLNFALAGELEVPPIDANRWSVGLESATEIP